MAITYWTAMFDLALESSPRFGGGGPVQIFNGVVCPIYIFLLKLIHEHSQILLSWDSITHNSELFWSGPILEATYVTVCYVTVGMFT